MADIACRCGEPWDSTGGLHYTHSDLSWWQYDQLVRGIGCPCCEGEFDQDPQRDEAWRRSVQFLADGSCEGGEPYVGFPLSVSPPWYQGHYMGENDPPQWEDMVDTNTRDGLESLSVVFNPDTSEGCAVLPPDCFLVSSTDIVRDTNATVALDALGDAATTRHTGEIEVVLFKMTPKGVFLTKASDGTTVLETLSEFAAALEDYPCLDDEAVSKAESEQREELIETWIEDHRDEIGIEWGLTPEATEARIRALDPESVREFFSRYEICQGEWHKTPKSEVFIRDFFPMDHFPLGWELLVTVSPEAWLAVPRVPDYDDLWVLFGFLVTARGGVEWIWDYPASQLLRASHGNYYLCVGFNSIPVEARQALNRALHEDTNDTPSDPPPDIFLR